MMCFSDIFFKNVCVYGPPPMMEAIQKQLSTIGIYKKVIIVEEI